MAETKVPRKSSSDKPKQPESQQDWYKPGPRIAEFHKSKARLRVLVGARGCGKTTSIAVETIGHGWHNAGAKIYILRKTETSNQDTTLDTFEQVFAECGSAYVDTGTSLFKKMEGGKYFRIPSAEAVKQYNEFMRSRPKKGDIQRWLETVGNKLCSFIQFSGVPDAGKRASRFRGYECSLLIFVEADQLDRADLDMAMMCLRWKGADGEFIEEAGCILDTNPPTPSHWIALMEYDEAPTDPNMKFWHIPMEDNEHNLPPGYVDAAKRQYARNPSMYRRMIMGEYAEAFDGSPVLFAFEEQHAYDELPFPRGAYLIRGWDFGTTNCIVWSAYWNMGGQEYWWDLHEYFATFSDIERQCRAAWDITREFFPFWNDRSVCAGVYDACDPAGNQKTDKGRSIDVMNSHRIYPKFSHKYKSLQLTLAAYNRLLEAKDKQGRFIYRICRKRCNKLYLASLGGYRYPEEGETGFGKDEPGKGPDFGDYDHIADASRYAKINFLRLMQVEMENIKRPVGKMAAPVSVNPKRRWR